MLAGPVAWAWLGDPPTPRLGSPPRLSGRLEAGPRGYVVGASWAPACLSGGARSRFSSTVELRWEEARGLGHPFLPSTPPQDLGHFSWGGMGPSHLPCPLASHPSFPPPFPGFGEFVPVMVMQRCGPESSAEAPQQEPGTRSPIPSESSLPGWIPASAGLRSAGAPS